MTPTIWDTLANTPWWIFFVYPYAVYISYIATKSRVVTYSALRNMSIGFFITTVIFLICIKQLTLIHTSMWLAALILGVVAGWAQFRVLRIKIDKSQLSLRIPGNWLLLFFACGMMYYQYRNGYKSIFTLELINSAKFTFWLAPVYGLFAGLFIGKAIYAKRCLAKGPFLTD